MEFAGEYTEFKESKISSGRFNHKKKKIVKRIRTNLQKI